MFMRLTFRLLGVDSPILSHAMKFVIDQFLELFDGMSMEASFPLSSNIAFNFVSRKSSKRDQCRFGVHLSWER